MARRITVYEVGPRDGLQNEARVVATPDKLALRLSTRASSRSPVPV